MLRLALAAVLLLALTGCTAGGEAAAPTAVPVTSEEIPYLPTASAESVPTEASSTEAEPQDEDFVRVLDWIPGIRQELKYAGEDNFTGEKIYEFWDAYLRYGTVKKLLLVQQELEAQGLGLKIWDGYRPVSAQWRLWEACPNAAYVANPQVGHSNHSRGNTVDITLVDSDGQELEMPTGFDDFSAKADRDYSDCTDTQAANARLLEEAMEKGGFTGYFGEWWHFEDTDSYPVEEEFEPPLG